MSTPPFCPVDGHLGCYRMTRACHHAGPDDLRACAACHAVVHPKKRPDACPFWCKEETVRQPKNVRVSAYVQECAERMLNDRHFKITDTHTGDLICDTCETDWPCDPARVALAVLERDP